MSTREVSLATRLRRSGVADPERAERLLGEIVAVTGVTIDDPPHALSYLADPDSGLLQLLRLAESARDAGVPVGLASLRDTVAGAKLGVLLGGSIALGDFLVRHPELAAGYRRVA